MNGDSEPKTNRYFRYDQLQPHNNNKVSCFIGLSSLQDII